MLRSQKVVIIAYLVYSRISRYSELIDNISIRMNFEELDKRIRYPYQFRNHTKVIRNENVVISIFRKHIFLYFIVV